MRPVALQRIVLFVAIGLFAGGLLSPHAALAASTDYNTGILEAMRNFGHAIGLSDTDPRVIAGRLIRVAMGFIGIIVLLLILSSGAALMFSGGDDAKIKSAKQTFFSALIGLFIMLSAYSIVSFVLGAFTTAANPGV